MITTRTPAQVYDAWIQALRSGDYKQHTSRLRTGVDGNSGYCCLGVVCDIAAKDGGPQWQSGNSFMGETGGLPEKMAEFLGLNEQATDKLIEMNDQDHRSFSYIARHLERTVKAASLKRLTTKDFQ